MILTQESNSVKELLQKSRTIKFDIQVCDFIIFCLTSIWSARCANSHGCHVCASVSSTRRGDGRQHWPGSTWTCSTTSGNCAGCRPYTCGMPMTRAPTTFSIPSRQPAQTLHFRCVSLSKRKLFIFAHIGSFFNGSEFPHWVLCEVPAWHKNGHTRGDPTTATQDLGQICGGAEEDQRTGSTAQHHRTGAPTAVEHKMGLQGGAPNHPASDHWLRRLQRQSSGDSASPAARLLARDSLGEGNPPPRLCL